MGTPTSRNDGLLWSLASYSQQTRTEPWERSLADQRQEQNATAAPVEHFLKPHFSLFF